MNIFNLSALTLSVMLALLLLALFRIQLLPLLCFLPIAIADGEYWRWISAHFIHINTWHMTSNLLAWLIISEYLQKDLPAHVIAISSLCIALMVSTMLYWLSPFTDYYVGFSAILHGLLSILCYRLYCDNKWYGALATVLLVAKLIYESTTTMTSSYDWLAFPVSYAAHQYGSLAGVVIVVYLSCISKSR